MNQLLRRCLIALLIPITCYAQSGKLDSSFNNKGFNVAQFPFENSYSKEIGKSVVTLQDSSTVLLIDQGDWCRLAHFKNNGEIDETYGFDGFSEMVYFRSVQAELLEGGKILVIGTIPDFIKSTTSFMIARFNVNGFLDQDFGKNGLVEVITFQSSRLNSLAIQKDEKILMAGNSDSNSDVGNVILLRCKPDGSLDSSFDSDGVRVIDFAEGSEQVNSIAVQNDGKIVLAGTTEAQDFALARINVDGSLDFGFGNKAISTIDFFGTYDQAADLTIQNDNKIIVVGKTNKTNTDGFSERELIVTRFNEDGTLDLDFGENGVATSGNTMLYEEAERVIATSKNIIVGGTGVLSDGSGNRSMLLAFFNIDGTPDISKSSDGTIPIFIPGVDVYLQDISLRKDGEISIGGFTSSSYEDFVLACAKSDGSLNESFSEDGYIIGYIPGGGASAFKNIVVQNDGKVLASGSVYDPVSYSNFAIARFNPDGTFDHSFGDKGKKNIQIDGDEAQYNTFMFAQPDNKIVIGGYGYFYEEISDKVIVTRLTDDGNVDYSFNGGALVKLDYNGRGLFDPVMTLQDDGKILTVANVFTYDGEKSKHVLIRLRSNGQLDRTFGGDGFVEIATSYSEKFVAIKWLDQSKILLLGYIYDYPTGNNYLNIIRYNGDGSIDKTFGKNGKIQSAGFRMFNPKYLILQNDFKIIVTDESRFRMLRFNPDGSLDITFGDNGLVETQFEAQTSVITSIAFEEDGKILASGYSGNILENNGLNSVTLRYRVKGILDSTFGINGKLVTNFGGKDQIDASYFYKDKLYVAGMSLYGGFLGRYILNASPIVYYRDKDKDSFGSSIDKVEAYEQPEDYVAKSGDCNDNDDTINPAAKEVCDGKDNNCDGTIDEGCNNIVSSFTLLNSKRDNDIQPLQNGDEIDLAAIPGNAINIRANTTKPVGSLVMKLTGTQTETAVENTAPYALFGNTGNNYKNWTPAIGNYTLNATTYSKRNGKGTAGDNKEVSFKIVYNLTLSNFTLVNAKINKDIAALQDGAVIDLALTPYINIRTNTDKGFTESVRFDVNGNQYLKVQSHTPYALATDKGGNYADWKVQPGTYTITATPYGQDGGKGLSGTPLNVTITIINSKNNNALNRVAVSAEAPKQQLSEISGLQLTTYPNPAVNNAIVEFSVPKTTAVNLVLVDASGKAVQQIYKGVVEGGMVHRKTINAGMLPAGLYFCYLITADGEIKVSKIIKQ